MGVSFILTMTLSTLPSQLKGVTLRIKALNLDTDWEFVSAIEDSVENSEDEEDVIEDEIFPCDLINVPFCTFNAISSTSLEVNPFF